MVEYYETMGFLPEAVLNALARLGWSLDDKTENMSLEFVTEQFTLDRVVQAPHGEKYKIMFGNTQRFTGGSLSVRSSYETMRRAGATARAMMSTVLPAEKGEIRRSGRAGQVCGAAL